MRSSRHLIVATLLKNPPPPWPFFLLSDETESQYTRPRIRDAVLSIQSPASSLPASRGSIGAGAGAHRRRRFLSARARNGLWRVRVCHEGGRLRPLYLSG